MNILCCFKISPDYDKVVEKDWAAAELSGPDTSYVPHGPGCYDEAALELALRLRDEGQKRGESVRITAATVSNATPAAFARQLYALGVDRVVRVEAPGTDNFRPETVSAALFSAFSGEKFDPWSAARRAPSLTSSHGASAGSSPRRRWTKDTTSRLRVSAAAGTRDFRMASSRSKAG